MSEEITVKIDAPEDAVKVDGFDVRDTDRARASMELEKMELSKKVSAEAVQKLSMEVSIKLLEHLDLDDEYGELFEKHKIGIMELRSLGLHGLKEVGITDPIHRAQIAQAAKDDKRADPPYNDGKPIEVRVKMGFARLANINTVQGTVDIKLFVDMYWNDPRLIGISQEHLPTQFMWYPDAYFYNSIDRTGENGGHINQHELFLVDSSTGLVLRPMEIEITCSVQLDLKRFPFDEHPILFTLLQSEDSTARDWVFAPAKDMPSCIKFFYNTFETPEFDLSGYSMDFFTSVGGNGVKYAQCFLYVYIRRRPLFYMWKLVVPLILTTLFAFTTFFFSIDDLEARSNTAQTTLLTTVALLFVLAQELPKTNYLTKIDKYLILCLGIQLLAWILSCCYTFTDFDNEDAVEWTKKFDYYCAIVIPTTYGVLTILTFVPSLFVYMRSKFEDPPQKPLKSNDGERVLEYYPLAAGRNIFYY